MPVSLRFEAGVSGSINILDTLQYAVDHIHRISDYPGVEPVVLHCILRSAVCFQFNFRVASECNRQLSLELFKSDA